MATADDVVYKELVLEFLSTCRYAPASQEARSHMIRFRLGAMSNELFEAGLAKESQLCDPLHRLMHRIIYTSIMQRRGCEKVSGEDMTYMWVLSDVSRFLNLPYALAISLTTRAAGASDSSPMAGGHFITHLARSYGILAANVMASMTAIPPSRTSIRYLENMRIIHEPRAGMIERMPIETAEGPQEQPVRRQRRRVDPPVQPQQPPPQLADVLTGVQALDRRMTRTEAHHCWMAET
ncbi:hypothetical protein L1887_15322 [Cichorium endivia]|nr:hypothetical protein L1887_15322 [Cichorium endivia]